MKNIKITMESFFTLKMENLLSSNINYRIVNSEGKQIANGQSVSPFITYVK